MMDQNPEKTESGKLFKKICRKAGTTLRDHAMIEEGDHVLIGISGGKDSLILMKALAERRDAMPFDFRLSAAHIAAETIGYRIDREKLSGYCSSLGIALVYKTIEPDLEKDPSKAACFVCSWHRRKKLFELTREMNCNKLALGHHRNDAVETLLMNMIYHGSISSLPYTLEMFGGRIRLIRPLLDLEEGLLSEYAGLTGLTQVEKRCPHENRTQRETIAQLLRQIESIHGKGPHHIFKSMGKIFPDYLPGNPS